MIPEDLDQWANTITGLADGEYKDHEKTWFKIELQKRWSIKSIAREVFRSLWARVLSPMPDFGVEANANDVRPGMHRFPSQYLRHAS